MNGLEAIKAMQEGKVVIYHALDGDFLNKINNGIVLVKGIGEPSDAWRVEVSFNFGGLYGEYVPLVTGWERVNDRGIYYFTGSLGGRCKQEERRVYDDKLRYGDANYFSTKEKEREISFKQTLFRKMQRFSDENGGSEIDWVDGETAKYHIYFDYESESVVTCESWELRDFGQVYFKTEEIAEQAIKLFKEDLIKYFTHDWSKGE